MSRGNPFENAARGRDASGINEDELEPIKFEEAPRPLADALHAVTVAANGVARAFGIPEKRPTEDRYGMNPCFLMGKWARALWMMSAVAFREGWVYGKKWWEDE